MRARATLAGLATLAGGCGGGAPLLHPAHALAPGAVRMGAGVSSTLVSGGAKTAMDDARRAVTAQGAVATPADEAAFARGALASILLAPGLAPWVGARAGFGAGDAGLTYSGRAVRVDVRAVTGDEHLALSAGLGASGVLQRPSTGAPSDGGRGGDGLPGLDATDVSGWGLDLPALVGWRSDGRVVELWAGLRAGYERAGGTVVLGVDPDPAVRRELELRGERLYGGGLVGVAVGVAPVWAALELDASYQRVTGELAAGFGGEARLTGLALAPSAALLAEF
ncbi:MAG: hypothetical protein OZ921_20685 [Sorangiineae bacterium]|nr:hypothetical protein [Sorangiineae bacterium]